MTAPDPDSSRPSNGAPDSSRRLLLSATAVSAAALGAGVAWWRSHGAESPPADPPSEGFWTSQWQTPQGGRVDMQSFQGRPLLVNFWATWCAPCVEELPLINDFYRQNKANGWQVLGLAVDKLTPVQAFLRKMPLDFPVGMAGLSGAEMARALGNLAGGLPFSVVLRANGMVVQRKLGRLHPQDLAAWLRLK